jgi:quinol monooxygenase YgiN
VCAEETIVVQLLVRLTAAPGRAPQLAEALRLMKRRAHGRPGCGDAYVAADIDDAGVLWYSEEWEDRDDLEEHMRTNAFARMLALLETAVQPPLMEFRVVSETRGLEYVAAVRGVTSPEREPAPGK